MPETVEARWLRERWNREFLGEYQDQWIAVLGEEIVAHGEEIESVVEDAERAGLAERRPTPLYAYVYFGRMQ